MQKKISNSYLIIKKIRGILKNTQVIQLMSIVRLSIFMLGITMMSCNSKKEQQLPAIGKSVALFDYFSYKGIGYDFYYSIDGEKNWKLLCKDVDPSYLSTTTAGGFTGTTIGLYATCK